MYNRSHPRTASLLALAGLASLLAAGLEGAAPQAPPAAPAAEADAALLRLNKAFRAAYGRGRAAAMARSGPVLVHWFDSLTLVHRDQRTETVYLPPLYDRLKTFSHVPLALYLLLQPGSDKPLTEEQATELRRYRELLVAAETVLGQLDLTAEQRERQQRVVTLAISFLDSTLKNNRVAPAELVAFTRRAAPLVLESAGDAARAQLDALHARVMAWRKEMSAEEWKRLRVVVLGNHMPRADNLAMHYFTRLLGPPVDDRRLVYAEGLGDEKRALDLLGTVVLDTAIGEAFFADPLRMHRDLLGDAAAAYVNTLAFPGQEH